MKFNSSKKRNIWIILTLFFMVISTECRAEVNFIQLNNQEATWHPSVLNQKMVALKEESDTPEPDVIIEADPVIEQPEQEVVVPLNEKIVNTAMQYLGVPYVWGGTSPSGFDCSGLVQYVCKQNEITISRTTYTQVNEGSYVSRENLQSGDIVFFGSSTAPHHVGIYIGDNKFIHAPQSGDVVKISNMSDRRDYATGRRFVN